MEVSAFLGLGSWDGRVGWSYGTSPTQCYGCELRRSDEGVGKRCEVVNARHGFDVDFKSAWTVA